LPPVKRACAGIISGRIQPNALNSYAEYIYITLWVLQYHFTMENHSESRSVPGSSLNHRSVEPGYFLLRTVEHRTKLTWLTADPFLLLGISKQKHQLIGEGQMQVNRGDDLVIVCTDNTGGNIDAAVGFGVGTDHDSLRSYAFAAVRIFF